MKLAKTATKRRTIHLFSFAAHEGTTPVSAADFFNVILTSNVADRMLFQGDSRVLILFDPERRDSRVAFRVLEGDEGAPPVIFNRTENTEEVLPLADGELMINATHVLVDTRLRLVGVEYNLRGAKAKDVETLLNYLYVASKPGSEIVATLSPVADQTFAEAIDQFERIHEASITIVRPNAAWGDVEGALNELADESNGGKMEVKIVESEKQGLAKDSGIIGVIKNYASIAHSTMKAAFVSGTRPGQPGYTGISLANHQAKRKVNVPVSEEGRIVVEAMYDRIDEMMDAADTNQ